ncbi:MAG: hypothetical protein AAGU75_04070 [Bacillota bacterium]
MKPLFRSFNIFIRQISRDSMLYAVCIAPLLSAFFFRFGIPYIEALLCDYFNVSSILSRYYLLFDLSLGVLTPFLFCFASSMVVLTEYDENMAGYLAVTPVGKRGYLISRFIFPAGISFIASIMLLSLFALTVWPAAFMVAACFLSSILSIATSLMIVAYSHNRVEGMAVSKMSGIVLFGLVIPFFLISKTQYLFSLLPSLWIAKMCLDRNFLYIIPALLTSIVWIWGLYRQFKKKFA